MAKRVGVVLSGCGQRDGSDVAEAMLALLVIERAGAEAVCAAPDAEQPAVVDHLHRHGRRAGRATRALEAARIAGQRGASRSAISAVDDHRRAR